MCYGNDNRVHYDEVDKTLDFYIRDRELVEKFMEVIENTAHDAIKENDYKRTLELVSMLVDAEEALEKFNRPKFDSSELLEEE